MFYFIGDVHGMVEKYYTIIQNIRINTPNAYTFQLGDMGCVFGKQLVKCGDKDFWIGGNHDNHNYDLTQKGYLGNYGLKTINGTKIFYIRGAESIDKEYRTEGKSWWKHEELTYEDFYNAINLCLDEKPDIIISHDCPLPVRFDICSHHNKISKTVQALTNVFESYQPKHWFFGHHHKSFHTIERNTNFYCLNELEVYKLKEQK